MEKEEKEHYHFKLEEGKTYFFICFSLVCGGKSTFFEEIKSQTQSEKNKSKFNKIPRKSDSKKRNNS